MLVTILIAHDLRNDDRRSLAVYADRQRAERVATRLSREQPNDDGDVSYYTKTMIVKERRDTYNR